MTPKNKEKFKLHSGFTLIEMLISCVVVILLSIISISTFTSVSNNQSLTRDVGYVIALIQKARTQTINGLNDSQYSIRFATSSVTLFAGSTYTSTTSNIVYNFSPKVQISSINLSNSSNQATFDFITGKSSATGTISFRLIQDANSSSTIVLYKTGLAETR